MRVIDAGIAQARRVRHPRAALAARLEAIGLAGASFVVLLGVVLASWGSVRSAPAGAAPDATRSAPPLLDLRTLTSAAPLEALLTSIPDPRARREAAEAIHRRATDPDHPLTHVGALASLRSPAGDPVLSRVDLATLKPSVVVRTAGEHRRAVATAAAVMLLAFWMAHVFRRWRGESDDPVLLPLLLLLTGIGFVTMVGLRDPVRDTLIATAFAGGVCAGIVMLLVASSIDYESSPLRRAVLLPLGLAIALAALLLLWGSGPGSSGVRVNLFGAQPVEAIRLLVVCAIAAALARRFEHLRELSEPATPRRPWLAVLRLPRWRDVRPVVASMALVLAFFFLQKDLGPALVLSGVVIALYATARGRPAFVFVGLAMLALGFAAAYAIGYPATVEQRVRIWSDPWNSGVRGGNQVAQGLWAMATGGAFGSGPGQGSPQAIPEGHTDFVLAAIGEELGLVGVLVVTALYGLLAWRCLRVSLRAPGDYSAMLGIGVTLALVVQALVIAAGLLGLLPLTGVVTPFLSHGRSSMIANCVAVGVVLAIARRRGPVRMPLRQPVRVLGGVLAMLAVLIAGRATWIQVVQADEMATAASLGEQADGGYRFEYNPRLLAAARTIERGTIRDRHGLVLATSRAAEMHDVAAAYRDAGLTPARTCDAAAPRCYPLGAIGFSVIGDWARQTNWAARNSSYLERDLDARLKGFDDRQQVVEVVHPRTGASGHALRRDFRALLPLVRYGSESARTDVRELLDRPRDLQASIDARLQRRVARALEGGITRGAHARGAAVVLDVETGEVLASVSYPWPSEIGTDARQDAPGDGSARATEALLDRVRYGLYPPGSTFKLLVAAAVLRSAPEMQSRTFACQRLPDGRVGNFVRGWSRPVRDDVEDAAPHGAVALHHGLVVSCNAYFAQLAMALGPQAIVESAAAFQIDAARPSTADALRHTLPHAAYGQADVLASPLKMARVAAAIAAGGAVRPVYWTTDPHGGGGPDARWLARGDAARLARDMREAVTHGTGRVVARNATPIAGKTGTAEVDGKPSHSWFVGFAPYGGTRPIAFAVIVEHAGYGGRSAAPIAGEIVDAARELGLFRR